MERYGVRQTIGEILDYVRSSVIALDILPRKSVWKGAEINERFERLKIIEAP
jgi:hypothetical protein